MEKYCPRAVISLKKRKSPTNAQVHFISDEIYALSVFDSSATFSSVLSLPVEKVNLSIKCLLYIKWITYV